MAYIRKNYEETPCVICRKIFKPKKKNNYYCSLRCNNKAKLIRFFNKLRKNPTKLKKYIVHRKKAMDRYYNNNRQHHRDYINNWRRQKKLREAFIYILSNN